MHAADVPPPKIGLLHHFTVPRRRLSLVWSNNYPKPTLLQRLLLSRMANVEEGSGSRSEEQNDQLREGHPKEEESHRICLGGTIYIDSPLSGFCIDGNLVQHFYQWIDHIDSHDVSALSKSI
ncbi:hypothetical protein MUK42_31076 [Musa troglodytarum]|uniref:Uncharacterized protein n=1 Tax=Musa troglodytarum TaxID=320322 RepID=A0A9E7JM72_9LILI|nr:hypothetical protein MUK42_31076 [Musa troglodytarum]